MIQRESRSSARCYCPVRQSLEKQNKESWWAVAYHMSATLSLTLCSVIHLHTQHIQSRRCVTSLSFLPTPRLSCYYSISFIPIQPLRVPLVFTISRSRVLSQEQVGFEQVGGRPRGRKRNKRMRSLAILIGGEVTVRPATTHLFLGAREAKGQSGNSGPTHLSLRQLIAGKIRDQVKKVAKHTCSMDFCKKFAFMDEKKRERWRCKNYWASQIFPSQKLFISSIFLLCG